MCFGDEIYLSDLVLLLKFNGGQKVCVTPIVGCVYRDTVIQFNVKNDGDGLKGLEKRYR
jgi:hypothetical protein